jgi:hypothetical protein
MTGWTRNKQAVLAWLAIAAFAWGAVFTAASLSAAPSAMLRERLPGRWLRPDGGYIIQVGPVGQDGRIAAAYFNPRPIHVALAEVRPLEGGEALFIELRDEGYPGSTYTLFYDAAKDLLRGVYFQATLHQKFDVVFVRTK